ncbi:MAG TPA: hypothetical protein VLM84_05865 [Chromatiaceae bacterium]|nr:hypothetical protein [Chromatiaceae bacterium]
MSLDRRAFLTTAASATAAFGSARLLAASGIATVEPAQGDLVRWLIESDRNGLVAALAAAVRAGLAYPALLGALAEATAREVRPYPQVGFKYHAFMGLHAVHSATIAAPTPERWLPVLWAEDAFKAAQAAQAREGPAALAPLPERPVPPVDWAEAALRQALEQWDAPAADAAVVDLLRAAPRDRLFQPLFHYGARDFRAIGHKAITVANCHRLLGVVAPEHAEPMLRSVVWALQNHEGEPNPAASDLGPDRPWRRNLVLAGPVPGALSPGGPAGDDPVARLLQVLREGSAEDASAALRAELDRGVPEADLWTAIFLAAGDLLVKQTGIVAVHANTTANALHYAYAQVGDGQTRRLLLLQAAAFMPLFRALLGGDLRPLGIDSLTAPEHGADLARAPEDIFATLGGDRLLAARQTLGYLSTGGAEPPFMALARRYTRERTHDYHDYKFTEAAFENAAALVSPWRERYLAAATLYLNEPADLPNAVVERASSLLSPHP